MGSFETPGGPAGPLVIVGGAEDKTGHSLILRELIVLAGGPAARIAVLTVASQFPRQVGATYANVLARLGAGEVRIVHMERPEDAERPDALRAIEDASAVYFSGGIQGRITHLIGGSTFETLLQQRWREGVVVGGTSAGAAAMSEVMILGGGEARKPEVGPLMIGRGLGFVPDVIVDQHFRQRGRIWRLRQAVAQHPDRLGLGIDEDTAIVLHGEAFEVIGAGGVTVVEARPAAYVRAPEPVDAAGDRALRDVLFSVLLPGQRFDLARRRPVVRESKALDSAVGAT